MITLETEKAAMDVPSPAAGRVAQVKLKKGDKVSEGSLILLLESGDEAQEAARRRRRPTTPSCGGAKPAAGCGQACQAGCQASQRCQATGDAKPADDAKPAGAAAKSTVDPKPVDAAKGTGSTPAGGGSAVCRRARGDRRRRGNAARSRPGPPSMRRPFPRPTRVPRYASSRASSAPISARSPGSGPKSRITHEDVKAYVKSLLSARRGRGRRGRIAPEGAGSRFREIRRGRGSAACRAFSGSPARGCRRAGSTCRTSRSTMRRTSRTWTSRVSP